MARNSGNVTLEDVTIAFRNFAGKEDVYNREGDRNFSVFLSNEDAAKLIDAGWNVKFLKPRDDEDLGQAFVKVDVSYKKRPPRVGMVTSRGITYLTEEQVEMIDWVDIETADVTLNPYEWVVNGKTGIKAYLQTLFVKIEEDYLQMKWTSMVEEQKALPTGYIDGELVDSPYELER